MALCRVGAYGAAHAVAADGAAKAPHAIGAIVARWVGAKVIAQGTRAGVGFWR